MDELTREEREELKEYMQDAGVSESDLDELRDLGYEEYDDILAALGNIVTYRTPFHHGNDIAVRVHWWEFCRALQDMDYQPMDRITLNNITFEVIGLYLYGGETVWDEIVDIYTTYARENGLKARSQVRTDLLAGSQTATVTITDGKVSLEAEFRNGEYKGTWLFHPLHGGTEGISDPANRLMKDIASHARFGTVITLPDWVFDFLGLDNPNEVKDEG